MKTKQTKIHRSAAKWLPGAMVLAATTASSHAATVQITLLGNKISSTGGNQLFADLTGDTVADVVLSQFAYVQGQVAQRVGVNGSVLSVFNSSGFFAKAKFADGVGVDQSFNSDSRVEARFLNQIVFTDTRVNGGALTGAWLEVFASTAAGASADNFIEFSRLIFDDASSTRPEFLAIPGVQTEWQVSAVPEASSSLALLALGAGGLLTRRRTKRAA